MSGGLGAPGHGMPPEGRSGIGRLTSVSVPAVYVLYAYVALVAPKSVTDGFWAFFFFDELPGWVSVTAAAAPALSTYC